MALEAQYLGQATTVVDYTPSGAVAAGQVVVLNGGCYVTSRVIAADARGSLYCDGIYKGDYSTAGGTITDGAKVHFDHTNNNSTDSTVSTTLFGRSVGGASSSSGTITTRLISPGV